MTDEQTPRPTNAKIQAEIERKSRTRIEKMTLVMAWLMIILMIGGVFYASINALGWL